MGSVMVWPKVISISVVCLTKKLWISIIKCFANLDDFAILSNSICFFLRSWTADEDDDDDSADSSLMRKASTVMWAKGRRHFWRNFRTFCRWILTAFEGCMLKTRSFRTVWLCWEGLKRVGRPLDRCWRGSGGGEAEESQVVSEMAAKWNKSQNKIDYNL